MGVGRGRASSDTGLPPPPSPLFPLALPLPIRLIQPFPRLSKDSVMLTTARGRAYTSGRLTVGFAYPSFFSFHPLPPEHRFVVAD